MIKNNNNHQIFLKVKYLVILIINNTTKSFVNPSQNIFYVFVQTADSQLFKMSTLCSMQILYSVQLQHYIDWHFQCMLEHTDL